MANFRQSLLEFLQGTLHETPKIRYTLILQKGDHVRAKLHIGENSWTGGPELTFADAKDSAAHAAYNELRMLPTEPILRQRLGMPQVNRNFDIQTIRRSLATLKRDLRQHQEKRKLICLLSQVYPIIDELETMLQ